MLPHPIPPQHISVIETLINGKPERRLFISEDMRRALVAKGRR
jgi:hypothetical protein